MHATIEYIRNYILHVIAIVADMGKAGPGAPPGDAMAPAGTPPIGQGTTVVTSASGRKFRVASEFAPNFQGFISDYEKAGGVIGANSGGLAGRPGNASYHPLGRAIDVNQTGSLAKLSRDESRANRAQV
jgi:hypothetical protein